MKPHLTLLLALFLSLQAMALDHPGITAIEAEHYAEAENAAGACWSVIPSMGRTLSGVALMPYSSPVDGAWLSYRFALPEGVDSVRVHVVTKPPRTSIPCTIPPSPAASWKPSPSFPPRRAGTRSWCVPSTPASSSKKSSWTTAATRRSSSSDQNPRACFVCARICNENEKTVLFFKASDTFFSMCPCRNV